MSEVCSESDVFIFGLPLESAILRSSPMIQILVEYGNEPETLFFWRLVL